MITLVITGNLGRDPEMRYTPAGQAVTSFSVASTRSWANAAGEKQKETTWFRCSAWGKTAENVSKYLKKASKVSIIGRLNTDGTGNPKTFAGNDGITKSSFEVTVETIEFLDGGNHANAEGQVDPEPEETIPF